MNTENNNRIEKYKGFFNKEYLMGPNSLRLLDEMLAKYPLKEGEWVMDLGCGTGLTSMFLAKEAGVRVFATDLWIPAADNAERFKKWGVDDQVIPIHADANTLPYAEGYFDAIVSIDAYHYFGAKEGVFTDKILPFLKPGGVFIAAMPGVKEELTGEAAALLLEWMEGNKDDYDQNDNSENNAERVKHPALCDTLYHPVISFPTICAANQFTPKAIHGEANLCRAAAIHSRAELFRIDPANRKTKSFGRNELKLRFINCSANINCACGT